MSLSAEEVARIEMELLKSPDEFRVEMPIHWVNNICLPVSEGEDKMWAIFKVLTFGDNYVIERACSYETPIKESNSGATKQERDVNEVRRLLVKRNLLSWSLDVPIERENGWMTPESYERVGKVSGPLLDALLDRFEGRMVVTNDEEIMMGRQSSVLFSKNSTGVADACEAVNLFCTLGNFWEKFGVDRFTLPDLPYREYLMLKMMMSKEGESMRRRSSGQGKPSNTRVSMGGRTRPSRGVHIPQ